MMSNGALKMPAMAETVPHSVRSRCDLRAERVEVGQHGHGALHQGEVVAVGGRLADLADLGGDARQPDVVEEAGRVIDQRVVFVGAA